MIRWLRLPEVERLRAECSACEACGHVQAEPAWCHRCGGRTVWPDWAIKREAEVERLREAVARRSGRNRGRAADIVRRTNR